MTREILDQIKADQTALRASFEHVERGLNEAQADLERMARAVDILERLLKLPPTREVLDLMEALKVGVGVSHDCG